MPGSADISAANVGTSASRGSLAEIFILQNWSSSKPRLPVAPSCGRSHSLGPARYRDLPEAFRGDLRAFDHRRELGVRDLRIDALVPGEGRESAVATGHHTLPTDDVCEPFDPLCDQFWVLYKVSSAAPS